MDIIDEKIKQHEKCIECLKKQKENSSWENKYVIWKKDNYSEYIKIKKVLHIDFSQITFICDKLSIYEDKFEFVRDRKCSYHKFNLESISELDYDEKIYQMINLMIK